MTAPAASPVIDGSVVEQLRASIRGPVIVPGDAGYDEARRVWNGMIDRRPGAIARCSGVADAIAAVNVAREAGAIVAVRGGGHSLPGLSVCDGGIVIDLSPMRGIRVDPAARTAHAQGGVTWGELDRETQQFGLATTGGLVSTTGLAGLTLGGGIGWLMRRDGLACDRLISADVVTADGRFLTASASENSDLFWALRGGGGNFGIVTDFEYSLAPLGTVLGGLALFPQARGREVLRFYRDFVATAPDDLTSVAMFMTVPPLPFVPEHLHGSVMVAIFLCHAAGPERGEPDVRPVRALGPEVDIIGPMPYCALQSMGDAGVPPGQYNYVKSGYLGRMDDEVIDDLVAAGSALGSPLSALHIHHLQGAVSRVADGETAFSHRTAPFLFNAVSIWTDPAAAEVEIDWARRVWSSLQPASSGVYSNFLGDERDEGAERVRSAYSEVTYARLRDVKAKYDPTNFFRLNQNIPPRQ